VLEVTVCEPSSDGGGDTGVQGTKLICMCEWKRLFCSPSVW